MKTKRVLLYASLAVVLSVVVIALVLAFDIGCKVAPLGFAPMPPYEGGSSLVGLYKSGRGTS